MTNSRNKGNRGERAIAKAFQAWWGSDFARTPMSGGFSTEKFRTDWNAAGDLVTPDESFVFCVEAKWVQGWTLDQLLINEKCIVFKWWEQTINECPNDKLPLLVFKKNNQKFFCMLEYDNTVLKKFLKQKKITHYIFYNPKPLCILTLEDLMLSDVDIWKQNKETLTQQRLKKTKTKKKS